MITVNDLENWIDSAPSATKEVFSSISTSKSPSTQSAAIKSFVATVNELMKKDSLINSVDAYLKSTDIDTLVVFATDWSLKSKNTLQHKLMIAPFMGIWIQLLAHVYDLNAARLLQLKKEESEVYYQIGDGIFLAGLYLYLAQ